MYNNKKLFDRINKYHLKIFKKEVHDFFTFFRIVLIAIMVLMLTGIGFLAYNYESSREVIKIITGGAVILTVIYTIFTFEVNYIKLKKDGQHSKDLLTFNTAAEWNKPNIFDKVMLSSVIERQNPHLLNDRDGDNFIKFIEDINNIEYKKAVFTVINYLETLSLAVEKDLVNEDFVRNFFELLFKQNIQDYYFFIKYKRVINNSDEIWNYFTNLALKWGIDGEEYLIKIDL